MFTAFFLLIGLLSFSNITADDYIKYQQKSGYLFLTFKLNLFPIVDSSSSRCITIPYAQTISRATSFTSAYTATNNIDPATDLVLYFEPTSEYIGTQSSDLSVLGLTTQIGDWSSAGNTIPLSQGFTEICFANNCINCGSRSNFFWGSISLFNVQVDGAASATVSFTYAPTVEPTFRPTKYPTSEPTFFPSKYPSVSPTKSTYFPTLEPTFSPSKYPSVSPTKSTHNPSVEPTFSPSKFPTTSPTKATSSPTFQPTSKSPSPQPTSAPVPQLGWRLITASSSGKYVYVGDLNPGSGFIYKSSDYGVTWSVAYDYGNEWYSITTDPTGHYVFAGSYDSDGLIYKSSDFGSTWSQLTAPSRAWIQVAVSSDASTVYGINDQYGYLYQSTDSGATWNVPADILALGGQNWYGVGLSQDGHYVYSGFAFPGGPIYKSSDYGATFIAASMPSYDWRSLVASGTGKYVYGGAYQYAIIKSADYGVTWTVAYSVGADWRAIATVSTGQVVVATEYGGYIAKSTNYGVTWVTIAHADGWYGISISNDAKYVYSTIPGGYLYKSSDFGATFTIAY